MYNVQQAEWQKPPGDAHQIAVTVSIFTGKLGFCPLKTVETPLIGSRVYNCLINTLFFPSFINSTFSTTCFQKIPANGVVLSHSAHFFVVVLRIEIDGEGPVTVGVAGGLAGIFHDPPYLANLGPVIVRVHQSGKVIDTEGDFIQILDFHYIHQYFNHINLCPVSA